MEIKGKLRYKRIIKFAILILVLCISQIHETSASNGMESTHPIPYVNNGNIYLFFTHNTFDVDFTYPRPYVTIYSSNGWSIPKRFDSNKWDDPHTHAVKIEGTNFNVYYVDSNGINSNVYTKDLKRISHKILISESQIISEIEANTTKSVNSILYKDIWLKGNEVHVLTYVHFPDSAFYCYLSISLNTESFVNLVLLPSFATGELYVQETENKKLIVTNYEYYSAFGKVSNIFLYDLSNGIRTNFTELLHLDHIKLIALKAYQNQLTYLYTEYSSSDNYLGSVNLDNYENTSVILPKCTSFRENIAADKPIFYDLMLDGYTANVIGFNGSNFLHWSYDINGHNLSIREYKGSINNRPQIYETPLINNPHTVKIDNALTTFWVGARNSSPREIYSITYDKLSGWTSIEQVTNTNNITDDYNSGLVALEPIFMLLGIITVVQIKRKSI